MNGEKTLWLPSGRGERLSCGCNGDRVDASPLCVEIGQQYAAHEEASPLVRGSCLMTTSHVTFLSYHEAPLFSPPPIVCPIWRHDKSHPRVRGGQRIVLQAAHSAMETFPPGRGRFPPFFDTLSKQLRLHREERILRMMPSLSSMKHPHPYEEYAKSRGVGRRNIPVVRGRSRIFRYSPKHPCSHRECDAHGMRSDYPVETSPSA